MTDSSPQGRVERASLIALSGVLGAMPDHLGQFRLASAYLSRRRGAPPTVLVQRMRGGTRAALDLSDRTQGIAYLTRRYEPELVDYIVRRLPPGGVFADVGAHVGLISTAVARRRPAARVIAFEPLAANADRWLVNRELSGTANAELVRCALAAGAGRRAFHPDDDSGAGHLSQSGSESVDVTTFDEFAADAGITRIDVMKIDTEGGELGVLQGASGMLAKGAIQTIVCEFNAAHLERQGLQAGDVEQMLTAAGLRRVPLPAPRRAPHRRRPDAAPLVVDAAFELSR